MPLWRIGSVVALTIVVVAPKVSAQDEPRVGIAMGYPASVGIVWHVSDRLALRPEIGASQSSGEVTGTVNVPITGVVPGSSVSSTVVSINDNWQVSAGISALFYLTRHDALRTYVSPRWAYTRTSSTSSNGPVPSAQSTSAGNGHFVSGSFGAQYALARRFSVFGEVGAAYTRIAVSPTSSGFLVTESVTHGVSTRSGAGVILYF